MEASPVIIGSGFGDEGKGLITDFESRRLSASVVVRFNGGAQAGHTVQEPSGSRHVFGHIGSGSFSGADTYLSSHFILNPLALQKELRELQPKMTRTPKIFVHQDAIVSTLYDMALNSLVELQRGSDRHGSCGLGINETVTRSEANPIGAIRFKDFRMANSVVSMLVQLELKLAWIRKSYVPQRLQALGIEEIPEPYKSLFDRTDFDVMARELYQASLMIRELYELTDFFYDDDGDRCVFEGAQGLSLDEDLGDFPHVTRSLTGLPYAMKAATELGLKALQPIYVTRCYSTRHGAGRLSNEGMSFGGNPVDITNIQNEWQGSIRYAPLDIPRMSEMIERDLERGKLLSKVLGVKLEAPTIALTCLDQIENEVRVITGRRASLTLPVQKLPKFIEDTLKIKVSHTSHGPTWKDVKYFE